MIKLTVICYQGDQDHNLIDHGMFLH